VGGQHHAPAALPPGKTRYTLYWRLGRPQGRSGLVRKISPLTRFDPRTVQPVVSRYTDFFKNVIGLTLGGSSPVHIYIQTVHRIQQYSTHLHTNSTQNTAVHYTFTHKQYTQYSSPVHIYIQTVHTIQRREHTNKLTKEHVT
jgi:uncharacterized integral membrane protein